MAIKLEGGGGKALVALKKDLFFAASIGKGRKDSQCAPQLIIPSDAL